MSKTDGGPAYPAVKIEQRGDPAYKGPTKVYFTGMTLRDWFAGQVLTNITSQESAKVIATSAYRYADAMLEAREAADE